MYAVIELHSSEKNAEYRFRTVEICQTKKEAIKRWRQLIAEFKKYLLDSCGSYERYQEDLDRHGGLDFNDKYQWWYMDDTDYTTLFQLIEVKH